jgi:DNA-binding beta-propeller fold protein YncE
MTLAIDQDDKLYATDPANNRILKFDEDGQFLTSFDLPDDGKPIDRKLVFFYDPWGVAVDGAGNIYVSNSYFLRKFDADGNILAEWSTSEGDLYRGGRVAVDVAGNIYIVAEGDVTTADNKPFKALVLKKFEQSAPE